MGREFRKVDMCRRRRRGSFVVLGFNREGEGGRRMCKDEDESEETEGRSPTGSESVGGFGLVTERG